MMYAKGMKRDEGLSVIKYILFGNIFLALLKGTVGLLTDSAALKADAVNSAGDVVTSLVVLLALRYALKPRDEGHHYGHGKMEALVSLAVGAMILVSTGFLLWEIALSIINGSEAAPSWIALCAAAVSIAAKSVMFKITYTTGKRLSSIALITNAKDHRNDIIATSGAVLAILLAFLGQSLDAGALLLYSEPVVAAVISAFIIKTAVEIIAASSRMLLDAAPEKETVQGMRQAASCTEGVIAIDWVKCRAMGRGLLVDLAIQVNGHISVEQGHGIGDGVKDAIMESYPQVLDVLVHINPEGAAK
jgi:cation diffusion facilitator family transporter